MDDTETLRIQTAQRQAQRRASREHAWLVVKHRVLPVAGTLVGLVLLGAAAFTVGLTLGLVVSGALVIIAEWRIRG